MFAWQQSSFFIKQHQVQQRKYKQVQNVYSRAVERLDKCCFNTCVCFV